MIYLKLWLIQTIVFIWVKIIIMIVNLKIDNEGKVVQTSSLEELTNLKN